MAYKTMLRQLISKWGVMSIDMMSAMDADMAVINEDGDENIYRQRYSTEVIDMEQPPQEKLKILIWTRSATALFGN